jgi:NB-ARC domain
MIMGSASVDQNVRLHGLYGLGGIGKSTLVQRFFSEASSRFGGRKAFVHVGQDVRFGAALLSKQRDLLKQIGGFAPEGSSDAKLRDALRSSFQSGAPLLLVLDDLWDEQQLAALLGCELHSAVQLQAEQWASGSRVLITARDKAVVTGRLDGAAKPQLAPQQVLPLPELAAQ